VLSLFLFVVYLQDLSKPYSLANDCSILLYADDILLLSLSVTRLEQLLHACECEPRVTHDSVQQQVLTSSCRLPRL